MRRPARLARSILLTLPCVAALAAGTASAAAAEPSAVTRHDIDSVCPQFRKALEESLAETWERVRKPGIVQVRLTLKGDRSVDVTPLAGTRQYVLPVRNAVRDLACRNDAGGNAVFVFNVAFTPG